MRPRSGLLRPYAVTLRRPHRPTSYRNRKSWTRMRSSLITRLLPAHVLAPVSVPTHSLGGPTTLTGLIVQVRQACLLAPTAQGGLPARATHVTGARTDVMTHPGHGSVVLPKPVLLLDGSVRGLANTVALPLTNGATTPSKPRSHPLAPARTPCRMHPADHMTTPQVVSEAQAVPLQNGICPWTLPTWGSSIQWLSHLRSKRNPSLPNKSPCCLRSSRAQCCPRLPPQRGTRPIKIKEHQPPQAPHGLTVPHEDARLRPNIGPKRNLLDPRGSSHGAVSGLVQDSLLPTLSNKRGSLTSGCRVYPGVIPHPCSPQPGPPANTGTHAILLCQCSVTDTLCANGFSTISWTGSAAMLSSNGGSWTKSESWWLGLRLLFNRR